MKKTGKAVLYYPLFCSAIVVEKSLFTAEEYIRYYHKHGSWPSQKISPPQGISSVYYKKESEHRCSIHYSFSEFSSYNVEVKVLSGVMALYYDQEHKKVDLENWVHEMVVVNYLDHQIGSGENSPLSALIQKYQNEFPGVYYEVHISYESMRVYPKDETDYFSVDQTETMNKFGSNIFKYNLFINPTDDPEIP